MLKPPTRLVSSLPHLHLMPGPWRRESPPRAMVKWRKPRPSLLRKRVTQLWRCHRMHCDCHIWSSSANGCNLSAWLYFDIFKVWSMPILCHSMPSPLSTQSILNDMWDPMAKARNSRRFQDHWCVPFGTAVEGGLFQLSLVQHLASSSNIMWQS